VNNELLNEFNKDLHLGMLKLVFKDIDGYYDMIDSSGNQEMLEDIEVDIYHFIEEKSNNYSFDIPTLEFYNCYLQDKDRGLFYYSEVVKMYLTDAKVKHNWREDEDGEYIYDENEDEYEDIEADAIITAHYKNWQLDKINIDIEREDKSDTYEMWPANRIPTWKGEIEYFDEELKWNKLQALLEVKLSTLVRERDIKRWNDIQKDLWLKTIEKLSIDKNDVHKFLKFGKFFYDYVNRNNETPTIRQIAKILI